MNSRIIIYPFALAAAYLLYELLARDNYEHSIWLIPLGIILASYFIFRHQIEFWWKQKFPVAFDPMIDKILSKLVPTYDAMTGEEKKKFQERLDRFISRKDFIGQNLPKVPDDITNLLSSFHILLTMDKADYELEDYDRIVFYSHPFLTPNQPDDVHVVEVEHEDGTIIFSLEQLIPGIQDPKQYYNTALHAFAGIYLKYYPVSFEVSDEQLWTDIERVGFVEKRRLSEYLGIKEIDPKKVLIHYYVYHHDQFPALMPEYGKILDGYLPIKRNRVSE